MELKLWFRLLTPWAFYRGKHFTAVMLSNYFRWLQTSGLATESNTEARRRNSTIWSYLSSSCSRRLRPHHTANKWGLKHAKILCFFCVIIDWKGVLLYLAFYVALKTYCFFYFSFIQFFSFLFHYAPLCSLGIMGKPLKHGAWMQYIPPKHGYF